MLHRLYLGCWQFRRAAGLAHLRLRRKEGSQAVHVNFTPCLNSAEHTLKGLDTRAADPEVGAHRGKWLPETGSRHKADSDVARCVLKIREMLVLRFA